MNNKRAQDALLACEGLNIKGETGELRNLLVRVHSVLWDLQGSKNCWSNAAESLLKDTGATLTSFYGQTPVFVITPMKGADNDTATMGGESLRSLIDRTFTPNSRKWKAANELGWMGVDRVRDLANEGRNTPEAFQTALELVIEEEGIEDEDETAICGNCGEDKPVSEGCYPNDEDDTDFICNHCITHDN